MPKKLLQSFTCAAGTSVFSNSCTSSRRALSFSNMPYSLLVNNRVKKGIFSLLLAAKITIKKTLFGNFVHYLIRLVARGQRGGKKESFFIHTKAF
jgi:hypothetical protein